jgi:hypothetical protein
MTDRGSSRPLRRLARMTRQLALFVFRVVLTAFLWVLWTVAVLVLHVSRPFVSYPLMFAAMGAAGAAVWFGFTGAWTDAAQAALVVVVVGGLLTAYGTFAERLDPDFFRSKPYPPWWWYF